MKRLIDDLRKAQTVNQMFGAFSIAPCYGMFNERCNELADILESKYYEKPLSADGTPVDLCTWWYGEDGQKWHVVGYRAGAHNVLAAANTPLNHPKPLKSKWLRMERPDSWSLIIDDAISLTDTKKKAELVERCKKLAGERNG